MRMTVHLGLRDGAQVELCPGDWGMEHRWRRRLIGLTRDEATMKSREDEEIYVHAPRMGFKIVEIGRKRADDKTVA